MEGKRGAPRKDLQHGTRSYYVQRKCRCELCKKANRDYANERDRRGRELAEAMKLKAKPEKRTWHGFVGDETFVKFRKVCQGSDGKGCPKKAHLRKDSKGNLCNYCRGSLLSKHETVDPTRAREHIGVLERNGYTRNELARMLDMNKKTLAEIVLGRSKTIEVETEAAILGVKAKGHLREADDVDHIADCTCGLSHAKPDRLARIRRMLPCRAIEVHEAYPCIYPVDGTQRILEGKKVIAVINRMLFRDLNEAGGVLKQGTWYPSKSTRDGGISEMQDSTEIGHVAGPDQATSHADPGE